MPKKIDPKKEAEEKKAEEEKKKKEDEDKKHAEAIRTQKQADEQLKIAAQPQSQPPAPGSIPPPPQRGETANAPPSAGQAQAQGEQSVPPISRQPAPPAVQKAAEERAVQVDEKRDEAFKSAEEKRRAEEKAVKAEPAL